MSSQGVRQVMNRLFNDEGFMNSFRIDPVLAMNEFDLTAEEVASFKAIDPSVIRVPDRDVARRMDMKKLTVIEY
jgi:hypothetical protein